MRTVLAVTLLAFGASGCVAATPKISAAGEDEAAFVVDKTGQDTYPTSDELKLDSCRYGIHHMARGDFTPSKAQAFGALLTKHVPGIAQRKVVLEQYDVYYNHRAKAPLPTGVKVGRVIGGLIGGLIAAGSSQDVNEYPVGDFTLDADPLRPRTPGARTIGCDNAHEGEYEEPSDRARYEMIVTWLRFTVDGTPYHVRSLYPFRSKAPYEVTTGVVTASNRTDRAGGRAAWPLLDSQQLWLNSGDPRTYVRRDLAIAEWP